MRSTRLLILALLLLASPAWAARVIRYVGGRTAGFAGTVSNQTVNIGPLAGGMGGTAEGGDLVMVTYCTGSTADRTLTITNTTPTAYTYLSDLYQNGALYDSNMRVGYRFMPSTPETQVILSQTFDVNDSGRYTIHVFRGVDPGTPIDVTSTTAGGTGARTVNPAAITPGTAGAWIYIAGCGAGATGGTYTASHLTAFLAGTTADTNDGFVGAGWYRQWASGAYDGANFAGGGTTTANDSWNSTTVALRPATLTSAIKPTGSNVSAIGNPQPVDLVMPTGENVTAGNSVLVGCSSNWAAGGGESHALGDLTKTAGTSTIGTIAKDVDITAVVCDGTNYCSASIWRVPITGSGTLTLRLTNAGAQGLSCVAQEYSGFDATSPLQGSNTGSGASGAPTTGTVAATGEALFFGAHSNGILNSSTVTEGLDFDALYELENGTTFWSTGGAEERIVTTDTTDAADWVAPTTVGWAAVLGVYQDTVAGGGPTCEQSIALLGVGCR